MVKPGDIIVADEHGLVAVPKEAIDLVMENLQKVIQAEEGVNRAIARGTPLDAIKRRRHQKRNYCLQTLGPRSVYSGYDIFMLYRRTS